jgi:hypothetical protein
VPRLFTVSSVAADATTVDAARTLAAITTFLIM